MFFIKKCTKSTIYGVISLVSFQIHAQDTLILINSDTLLGQLKKYSTTGVVTFQEMGTQLERDFDLKFVNLAKLSTGQVAYRRPDLVMPYHTLEGGRNAVYSYSPEMENSINLLFPGTVKRTIVTHINTDYEKIDLADFTSSIESMRYGHKRNAAELLRLYSYASNSFIVLIEFSDPYRITWYFFSPPVQKEKIESFVRNKNFTLQQQWSYYSDLGEISNVGAPFTMKFSEDATCLFTQSGKESHLVYTVGEDASIGFKSKENKRNNSETVYEVVYLEGNVMRYSIFYKSKLGVLTRQIGYQ